MEYRTYEKTGGAGTADPKRTLCRIRDLYNSQIPPGEIAAYCKTSEGAEKMLQGAFESLHLSGRACNRILRVARTAADLDGKERIEEEEIAEAIGYRSFDKHSWKQGDKL